VHEDVFEMDIKRLVMGQHCLFSPTPLQKLEIIWSLLYNSKVFILRLVQSYKRRNILSRSQYLDFDVIFVEIRLFCGK